jgi:phenylacetic acid degradation operon negative regulatory protein
MKAKTEELLYFLLWGAEQLSRPTFRNLSDSFEEWVYRQGFQHQLWQLERQELLEKNVESEPRKEYRLSERGRVVALGGRDPVAAWDRLWDGQWRMVLFDLPEVRSADRARLRRFLKHHRFGYLQNSVWITPDPLAPLMKPWMAAGQDVESLITFEARPGSGESADAIVSGAWSFDRINALYAKCLKILGQLPAQRHLTGKAAGPLRRWARAEREAWREAISSDPLLPRPLLPNGYLGEQVWLRRQSTLAKAAELRGDEV